MYHHAFHRVRDAYIQHGDVEVPRQPRAAPVVEGPLRQAVRARLEENPIQSARAIARELGKWFL